MEPLKEYFNAALFQSLAAETKAVYPAFSEEAFYASCMEGLENLELKERLRQTSVSFRTHLPPTYGDAMEILWEVAPTVKDGLVGMIFPDFVGLYGLDEFDLSMKGLAHFTQFSTSEFAIREFLRQDFDRTIQVMYGWSEDANHHVRRLSSEGCRPRLPWSFQLKNLVKDPSPVLPILATLKADPELYVRKSVANHLNDITKDHADKMLELVKSWDRSNPHTEWIVKQGARTLIKQGHPGALLLRGFDPNPQVEVSRFSASPAALSLGNPIEIIVEIKSTGKDTQKLAVDYCIHYVKKAGTANEKVFKWKELELPAGESVKFEKSQMIKDFTTRKHHPGFHKVEVMVNGVKLADAGFELSLG